MLPRRIRVIPTMIMARIAITNGSTVDGSTDLVNEPVWFSSEICSVSVSPADASLISVGGWVGCAVFVGVEV